MHRILGDNFILENGKRMFTDSVPPTTVPADWFNAVQEEIANAVESQGLTLSESGSADTRDQLAQAISRAASYDALVSSQETFNAIWERVAANEYKIKDGIGSVYFKTPAGGYYNLSGPSSPLSGGDTWGKFSTGSCTFIMCDGSNYFQLGDTPSYFEISTSGTTIYNLNIQGIGVTATAITQTLLIGFTVSDCKIYNLIIKNRYSNASHLVVYGGISGNHIIGCSIENIQNTTQDTTVLASVDSISHAVITNIQSASGNIACLTGAALDSATQVHIDTIITGGDILCIDKRRCATVSITNVLSSGGDVTALKDSIGSTGITVSNSSAANAFIAFDGCTDLAACAVGTCEGVAENIAFKDCVSVSSVSVFALSGGGVYGFQNCENIGQIEISNCSVTGICTLFQNTVQITGAELASISATGRLLIFDTCKDISDCRIDSCSSSAADLRVLDECANASNLYITDCSAVTSTQLCVLSNSISNCTITNTIFAGSVIIFNACKAVTGCIIDNVDSSSGTWTGFSGCKNVSNSQLLNSSGSSSTRGFLNCATISGCNVDTVTSSAASMYAFENCNEISACTVTAINAATGILRGFQNCTQLTGNRVHTVSTSLPVEIYNICVAVTGCRADNITSTGNYVGGYFRCDQISGCYSSNITVDANAAYGFFDCEQMAGCYAYNIEYTGTSSSFSARGFQSCSIMSACTAGTITASNINGYAYGFHTCTNLSSSCYAANVTSVTAGRAVDFNASICWHKQEISGTVTVPAGTQSYAHGISNLRTNKRLRQVTIYFDEGGSDRIITGVGPGTAADLCVYDDTNVTINWGLLTTDTVGDAVRIMIEYQA